jgi:uncharacterized protein YydD (DUF2326 family)
MMPFLDNSLSLGIIFDKIIYMANNEPTTQDILDAINEFSGQVDQRFEGVDQRFQRIESQMVTKDYLDEKMADMRGDLVVLTRKEDQKVKVLVGKLLQKGVLSDDEATEILAMEPFPQLGL